MEDFAFDINGILSDEEANKFFENDGGSFEENNDVEEPQNDDDDNNPAEEEEEDSQNPSEKVGVEETEENASKDKGDGTSPNVYSSIASALKNDGIFPDFTDEEINGANSPEAFGELVEKTVRSMFDDRLKRINDALQNGVQPDTVRSYEQTIQYLDSIDDNAISAEGEEGENLRKQLIYNELIKRGISEDRARKKVEQSFSAGSDIDDAKDALSALKSFYNHAYEDILDDAKQKAEQAKAKQKKQSDDFKKMILEDEIKIGETKLDKKTCQKVYDAVSKPVYKDPNTGRLYTAVQKFQMENPLEFLKQLGMWYVLTDGGKDTSSIAKRQIEVEKNKALKELASKINSTNFNSDGSLRYMSGQHEENGDILLSDDWQVGV